MLFSVNFVHVGLYAMYKFARFTCLVRFGVCRNLLIGKRVEDVDSLIVGVQYILHVFCIVYFCLLLCSCMKSVSEGNCWSVG